MKCQQGLPLIQILLIIFTMIFCQSFLSEPRGFMLERNKRKHGASDDFPDMKGVKIINKLDHVMACNSAEIKYAPFTEDVFYRRRKKRRTSRETASTNHNKARVERFHRFLSNCEGTAPW
ncbi:paired amphipathic helix protein Sin3-like 1 [Prosopis cineraria]|uniref:paired amphipathic helix protein Sin3-like 1 n=1 Tax=Prosopis cineraria TaxID=364024 RepID=UPI0024100762|nr:paired amphipathic helix protein Sin3-like 1 [Prosopis cineraria]